jgi:hypothetical protein
VLKPGGTALLLEIVRPEGARAHGLALIYIGRIVPTLCRGLTSGREARNLMRYYWDTIEACVAPSVVLDARSPGPGLRRRYQPPPWEYSELMSLVNRLAASVAHERG